MNALNSYSWFNNYMQFDMGRIESESSSRIFEKKGLFIIPYDTSRVVAYVKADFKVIAVENEYQSLWTNPELGFYGYAHIRDNKKPIGTPIQLNHRSQTILWWHPLEQYTLIDVIGTLTNIAVVIDPIFTFGRLYFPAPTFSDLSFGFKTNGRYQVTVTIGYWLESLWDELEIPKPTQYLPNPGLTEDEDPNDDKALGDPNTPISPPYDQGTSDFGESDDAPPPPPPPELPASPFVIIWSSYGPGFDFVEVQSLEYTGPQITSYTTFPRLSAQNRYVIDLQTVDGARTVDLGRGGFATEEQNNAFLANFEFVRIQSI